MTRKEIFNKINEFNLASKVIEKFGDNYTRVSNDNLLMLLSQYANKNKKPKINLHKNEGNKLDRLIKVLQNKHILLPSEVKYIYEG